ncbi:ankyrin repeat domain-containing protein [Candidatus Dependentiae bacterium]|nr:ankyrin repeat domain-containing protein [Candidatus Dependentiae bacterium]
MKLYKTVLCMLIASLIVALHAQVDFSDKPGLPDTKSDQYVIIQEHDNKDIKLGQRTKNINRLHAAAFNGDYALCTVLLEDGVDCNAQDRKKRTPLHLASSKARLEVMDLLLERGALINACDNLALTPLHYAVEEGSGPAVFLLLDNRAQVNVQNNSGETPLHWAIAEKHKDIVTALLSNKAQVDLVDNAKRTPLHWAIYNDQIEIAQLLLANGADSNAYDHQAITPLHVAAIEGNASMVEMLIDKNACVNVKDSKGRTALYLAVSTNKSALVNLLLEKGAEVNAQTAQGVTSLYKAAEKNYLKMAELLLQKGATVYTKTNRGITPLHRAVAKGNRMLVELLLSYYTASAQIPSKLCSKPLIQQAQENIYKLSQAADFKSIAHLLAQGAYPNAAIKAYVASKQKRLFKAIKNDNVVKVIKLLKKGFPLNTCDEEGNALIHKAIQSNSLETVNLLFFLGAYKSLDKVNTKGLTPIHLLLANDKLELLAPVFHSSDTIEQQNGKRKQSDSYIKHDT